MRYGRRLAPTPRGAKAPAAKHNRKSIGEAASVAASFFQGQFDQLSVAIPPRRGGHWCLSPFSAARKI